MNSFCLTSEVLYAIRSPPRISRAMEGKTIQYLAGRTHSPTWRHSPKLRVHSSIQIYFVMLQTISAKDSDECGRSLGRGWQHFLARQTYLITTYNTETNIAAVQIRLSINNHVAVILGNEEAERYGRELKAAYQQY